MEVRDFTCKAGDNKYKDAKVTILLFFEEQQGGRGGCSRAVGWRWPEVS